MVSISLADVVAFLRPRGALGVLEGAPVVRHGDRSGWIHPIGIRAFERGTNPDHDAALYLGDDEICPAAEGWAIRVLLIALGIVPEVVKQGGLFGVATEGVALYWPAGGDRLARQVWSWCPVQVAGWRQMYEPLIMPHTPAARLAAVLRYEMERAK